MNVESQTPSQTGACILAAMLLLALTAGCEVPPVATGGNAAADTTAQTRPATAPAPLAAAPASPQADEPWATIAKIMERTGVFKDGVYVITVPRDDLEVQIEGMGVPIAAGIESTFWFYKCPCGKTVVVGQFVTCDYESNDVVDALRQNALMKIPTIAPLLLYDRPRMMLVRFQGEGDPAALSRAVREALRWMANERMAPDPNFRKPEIKRE
jgi:hypothetical protein